ncbi:hypothetical protein TVAG_231620 [Trichomonas vaginalis G3]|uniref:Uncharacterized protein n=1 Tax=Trichomonas vaginalis (strain ATCC PRA-98 / G3) TaxID=412133 RepID=A2G358_TRIV3|nr:hypothetical protein TVAGG3_0632770 [Trichomonas vaginalis G3]EAX88416.1 hypothetical protein TVAG_231620 [Trichomonas vaginalis G3]KAI5504646.1 hypothetical protein TVAGG3_0632770 [Trichomonas vaginalis G3]|eukprot:XP_001301346.1 hypothetical protein [Trichomonas vaginalis G3]
MQFESLRKLQKHIYSHILADDMNNISCNVKRDKFHGIFSLIDDPNSTPSAKLTSKYNSENTSIIGMVDTHLSAYASLRQQLKKGFKVEIDASTRNFTPSLFMKQPTFYDGMVSIAGIINSNPISAKFALGLSKSNSILTLCSFKSNTFEANLNFSVTENNAKLTTSALHQSGIMCSVSADIAQLTASQLQIGLIKGIKNKGIYSVADILQKSLTIGGTTPFKLGTMGFMAYTDKNLKPILQIGMYLPRKASFTCCCSQDGFVKMRADFSPRPWLDVQIRSQANALDSFNQVEFGYSLNFNL